MLVAVELKIDEFVPEYIGKMQIKMFKKKLGWLFCTCLTCYTSLMSNELLPLSQKQTLTQRGLAVVQRYCPIVKRLTKDLLLSYVLLFCAITAHELGHAVVGRPVLGTRPSINVGVNSGFRGDYYLINFFNIFFIRGLNPVKGYTFFEGTTNDPWKEFLVYAAGPLVGSISGLVSYKLLSKYTKGYKISKAVSLYIVANNIVNIVPFGTNDGKGMFEALIKGNYLSERNVKTYKKVLSSMNKFYGIKS